MKSLILIIAAKDNIATWGVQVVGIERHGDGNIRL